MKSSVNLSRLSKKPAQDFPLGRSTNAVHLFRISTSSLPTDIPWLFLPPDNYRCGIFLLSSRHTSRIRARICIVGEMSRRGSASRSPLRRTLCQSPFIVALKQRARFLQCNGLQISAPGGIRTLTKMSLTMTPRQSYLTVNVSVFCACPPRASPTWKVRSKLPGDVGMPVIRPVAPSKFSQAGAVPGSKSHS